MIKWKYLAIVIIAMLAIIPVYYVLASDTGWYVESHKIGDIEHSIIINYADGTTCNIPALTIFYKDKPIQSIQYKILAESREPGNIDPLHYSLSIETPFGTYAPISSNRTTVTDTSFSILYDISIWKLVSYSLPDGTYDITVHPSGSITYNNQPTNLPQDINFSLTIKDDRTLNLVFK